MFEEDLYQRLTWKKDAKWQASARYVGGKVNDWIKITKQGYPLDQVNLNITEAKRLYKFLDKVFKHREKLGYK